MLIFYKTEKCKKKGCILKMASDLQKILAKQKKQCYHSQQLGDIVAKAGKETLTFRGRQEYSVTD